MDKYDTVIVGAGFAGLACAQVLAEAGKKVLVLEKKSTFGSKVCANCLPLNQLQEMNIPSSFFQWEISKLRITTRYFSKSVSVEYNPRIIINRQAVIEWMVQKAKDAGAQVWTNASPDKINSSFIIVNDQKIGFDYLVGADGSRSLVRRYLGLEWGILAMVIQARIPANIQEIELIFDLHKTGLWPIYIIPQKEKELVMGVGADINLFPISRLKHWLFEAINKKFGKINYKLEAFPICAGYSGFKFGNIFLIGDAGGMANELTGLGIYPAYLSGKEIAEYILNSDYSLLRLKKLIRTKRIQKTIAYSALKMPRLMNPILQLLPLIMSLQVVNKTIFKFTNLKKTY